MNNRDYKNFSPGCIYHVYNRGNGKMNIFRDDQDLFNFVKRIRLLIGISVPKSQWSKMPFDQTKDRERIRLTSFPVDSFDFLAYCFMPNHYHFVIRQNTKIPINDFMHRLCNSYGKYFNRKYDHVGTILQDQFKASLVSSDEYLRILIEYIHENPRKAGIVDDLHSYRWSSYCEQPDFKVWSKMPFDHIIQI